ncbi:hypothetical protein FHG87_008918 [Trinorchestia longiramus]|nr:hypothetical protein FHG87_008918 [Trinorchestia longiramus]
MIPVSSLSDGSRHPPRLVEMKACEGNRMGSNLFYPADNTGYLYRVKRKRGSTLYFSCARNGCKATANFKRKKFPHTKKGMMKGSFEITSCHSHSEDQTVLVKLMFESACKKRSMNEETPYSVIIKEEKQKWQIDTVKEAGLISTLYQARKRSTLDGPPLTSTSDNSDQSCSGDDDGVQLNAELAYTRYGYRVECWKWALTHLRSKLSQNTSAECSDRKIEAPSADNSTLNSTTQNKATQDIYNKNDHEGIERTENVHNQMQQPLEELSKGELSESYPCTADISEAVLLRAYALHRLPLFLPCVKRCPLNPFCLTGYKIGTAIKGSNESKLPLTQQPRPTPNFPVGLQSCSPATAVSTPALVLLFHLRRFR